MDELKGIKHDSDKVLMGCIPPTAEVLLGMVLTYGAQKYSRENWRLIDNLEDRYMDACLRHINLHRRGEEVDPESGLPHLGHAATCLMYLLEVSDKAYELNAELKIPESSYHN